jgi:hypothetical protein
MYEPVKKALSAIGDHNRYQYITFAIFFMLNAFVNLMLVGPTFIFMNPLFTCSGM